MIGSKNVSGVERALVAVDITGRCVILATDGPFVSREIDAVGAWADEIFGEQTFPDEAGLYLWTGTGEWIHHPANWTGGEEWELNWSGEVRPVQPEELAALLKMEPPEEVDE